ncbi:hypothetical protein [uncultured Flavobacterium sp.]|uniref:hypothetical protein n=1 Tax=uncultured Flavobacterium sp. TaxID=165435 RepID=UPI0025D0F668|nr:hypothetical protein [uncultured Flavobacterium sp.]
MKFSLQEEEVIRAAIALRLQDITSDDKHYTKTKSILDVINSPFLKFTPTQKAILRGCIKVYAIYPNEELLALTDYDIFQANEELNTKFELIDNGLQILSKLKDDIYDGCRLFESVLEMVKNFSKIETVYYSLHEDKIYKSAVLTDGKKGLRIDSGNSLYEKFETVQIFRDQFMYEGTPFEIIARIKAYEKNNTPEENHRRLLAILTPALAN